ncbi:inorganic phosphate transporter [candidate division KSB1 bacterium]|nr:MAG: inorganic phosphate transporter [candidate division KSB1 bacterium]MBC6952140.1 anion permease [candidate division KSB1 bacterium]MCE7945609.1 anion permease [Chlorobi bacterium CHB1]RIK59865.1 MAG: inorganic phosphate transporter [candidate division KSB1 bacterium]
MYIRTCVKASLLQVCAASQSASFTMRRGWMEFVLFALVFVLAYLNGANDISKGIATLVGSHVVRASTAILWGTLTTTLGAMAGVAITSGLLKTFSSGILSHPANSTMFPIAVALGAIGWILFATQTGLPISTTHALTGGIIGAALAQLGASGIAWQALLLKVALPLAFSPVASFAVAWLLFPIIRYALSGVNNYCLCLEVQQTQIVPLTVGQPIGVASALVSNQPSMQLVADKVETCERTVALSVVKLRLADSLHLLTSGLTSFARGMNDTPKIAALLVGTSLLGSMNTATFFGFVAIAMLVGSLLGGRRVLNTLSEKITAMDGLEGFTANFGASALVTAATFFGLPLSTTHVTTSAIVGIGVSSRGRANWYVVRDILLAWLVTLPAAAILAYTISLLLN